jgi:hypothetical protein
MDYNLIRMSINRTYIYRIPDVPTGFLVANVVSVQAVRIPQSGFDDLILSIG